MMLTIATTASAIPFDTASKDWEGLGEFVALAKDTVGETHLVVRTTLDYGELKPEDGVILVHPEKTPDVDSLSRFMRAGGRVILLDDYGTGDVLLKHFGMDRMATPTRPAEMLRKNPELPLAEPASAHPTVADVGRVVMNHPTALKHPDLSPVLRIRERGDPANAGTIVAVAGAVQKGRLLVVADSSIVINQMMHYPGNRAFARGLLQYSVDDDTWGKRGGKLYLAVGNIEQRGHYGEEESWLSDLRDKGRELEDWLRQVRDKGMSGGVSYALAIVLGLALVIWVGRRAGKVHQAVAPRFTRRTPVVAHGGLAGHLAVVASPHASRSLAVLEWKGALEEELKLLLGVRRLPTSDVLLRDLGSRNWLDGQELAQLRNVLLTMSNVETLVLSRSPSAKLSDRDVVGLGETVKNIVKSVRERATKVVP